MANLEQAVAATLQRELDGMNRLEAVLGQEQDALRRRDAQALSTLAGEKQRLVDEIELPGRERQALLQGTAGDVGHTLIATRPALQALWQELQGAVQRCQAQNQVNGILLEKGRQQAQQLLALLLGQPAQQEPLYNARGGAATAFSHGRSLKV